MPILSLMYLCSFLDRGNAKFAGLVSQLRLVGNQYNIALPYCLFECPSNLVLKELRPSKYVSSLQLTIGCLMNYVQGDYLELPVSMGFVKTYPQLVGARICLGVGFFPGVVYYLPYADAFGGLLAFAMEFMDGKRGLEAWSWIFILEGIATAVVGIISLFIFVDFPVTTKFLTPEERAYVLWKKSKHDNTAAGEAERFAVRYITPLFGISVFLPFGFSTPITQLLTVPPYVFATITLFLLGHYSDKTKLRSPFILLGLTMCLIGFTINITHASSAVKYFGTFFCVASSYAAFPGVVTWVEQNVAGQYRRGVGMAIQIRIGNFGGAIATNIYRTQDAPRYVIGHGVELLFVDTKRIGGTTKFTVEGLHERGDRGPDFKYTL
ncbi:hypothetical protein ACEPAG_1842 [Sanghuangporus baumii]